MRNLGLCILGMLMSVSAFAIDEAPLCPNQQFVKGAFMSQAMYAEQVDGYIAASDPLFNQDGIWLIIDGPFSVDDEQAAIKLGQDFLSKAKDPFSKRAQTQPNVDAWLCLYFVGSHNQVIIAASPKFGYSLNPEKLATIVR